MNRIALISILVSSFCTLPSSISAPPNILYLFTDDHSIRTLGCYADAPEAYPWVKTPHSATFLDLLPPPRILDEPPAPSDPPTPQQKAKKKAKKA